ncbi:hypothetical protein FRX94_12850 [Corynebacterium canis]|uniref:ABC transporter permease n=2 Tax=Corynebacterium canis TaxID=679663 RepID=A0A5C5TUX9_9CORY|nr:ABC transporter permease [Corynebacterium canis]TWT17010.1 hypothetical protein FRX94_12850 [Corynebacterium canis]WJY75111.1 ABC-2 family transporter protein [Corynebacterium canis]
MMRTMVPLEWFKMRRLHLIPIMLVPTAAGFLFASRFFSGDEQKSWEDALLALSMAMSLTMPLVLAVVATRQTDIEHSSGGWLVAASIGSNPGALCRAKFFALAPIILAVTTLSVGFHILLGKLSGLGPIAEGNQYWVSFWLGLCVVNLWLIAFHIVLSARFESQAIGMGIGVVGAFIACFSYLIPTDSIAVKILPWSYYANATTATFNAEGIAEYVALNWVPTVVFAALGIGAFTLVTAKMNTKEQ